MKNNLLFSNITCNLYYIQKFFLPKALNIDKVCVIIKNRQNTVYLITYKMFV